MSAAASIGAAASGPPSRFERLEASFMSIWFIRFRGFNPEP
jgi:hypothetical protein